MEQDSGLGGLDFILILILLVLMFAPVVGLGLLVVYIIKKGYNIMQECMNPQIFSYLAFKDEKGNIFESGLLPSEMVDKWEQDCMEKGFTVVTRFNNKDKVKLQEFIKMFQQQNNLN